LGGTIIVAAFAQQQYFIHMFSPGGFQAIATVLVSSLQY
jgi:hypothetical protein